MNRSLDLVSLVTGSVYASFGLWLSIDILGGTPPSPFLLGCAICALGGLATIFMPRRGAVTEPEPR